MSNQFITSELLLDDPDLLDLINRFILRLPGMRDAITKAYDAEDWELLTNLVHQMKGVGGNYGYPILTNICFSIEKLLKEQEFEDIKKKLDEFKGICEKILAGSDENHKTASQS